MDFLKYGIVVPVITAVLSYGIAFWAARGWHAGSPKQNIDVYIKSDKKEETSPTFPISCACLTCSGYCACGKPGHHE